MPIRTLTLAAALLAGSGCVSYAYHSGAGGDYYSGTPSVEYRYVGGYYGYNPYWYGGYGYPGYYGYYGYPGYYAHRHHGYYGYGGYGGGYWGAPYYYGGAWGYSHGPYKPPRQNPPPVTPPPVNPPAGTTLRYLDHPRDYKTYPGHRDSAGRPYGVPRSPPPNYAGGNVRPPPPSRPLTPPPSQPQMLPPPSTPRVLPPSRPAPVAPVLRPVVPANPEARSTTYSPKGATRARSRSIDPDDP